VATRRVLTDSPFDTVEKHFDLLGIPPHALVIDGTSLGASRTGPSHLGRSKPCSCTPPWPSTFATP